eukprot:3652468-Pyramimonas_sp.AAC.1
MNDGCPDSVVGKRLYDSIANSPMTTTTVGRGSAEDRWPGGPLEARPCTATTATTTATTTTSTATAVAGSVGGGATTTTMTAMRSSSTKL